MKPLRAPENLYHRRTVPAATAGLGGESAFPRAVSVEELLVVTFTEAATEELRGRIRSNIHELRIACLRDSATDPL